MLFCLNPPHSLPFPHWPDGATLPAAAAADVSLARGCSSRTHLPGPRHTAARRRLSGPGEVAANSRARTALGEPRDSGEGSARKAPASSRPPLAASSRGWRNPGPQPRRAERPQRRRLPFSLPGSPGAPRGPALKRAGNLVYRPGSGAHRAFVWKVSISRSGCNVFLVTLALGRPAAAGEEGRSARFRSGFGGGSSG